MDGLSGLQGGMASRGLAGDQTVSRADAIKRRVDEDGKVENATEELEVMFSTMMVKEMRKSLGEGLFGSGPGVDTFEGWFDDHMGRAIAEGGAMELSGLLKAQSGGPAPESGSEETS